MLTSSLPYPNLETESLTVVVDVGCSLICNNVQLTTLFHNCILNTVYAD